MASISLSALTSSFTTLSFSSQISQKSQTLTTKPCFRTTRTPCLTISASSAAVATPLESESESLTLEKYVKSRLPGGFAAQTIIGTGRRKCAIARVVLQEGTGKFIINYRDAKVNRLVFSF